MLSFFATFHFLSTLRCGHIDNFWPTVLGYVSKLAGIVEVCIYFISSSCGNGERSRLLIL